jgi:hypothetical protein
MTELYEAVRREVLDFEQWLGFVEREEKAQQHNIAPYLATM